MYVKTFSLERVCAKIRSETSSINNWPPSATKSKPQPTYSSEMIEIAGKAGEDHNEARIFFGFSMPKTIREPVETSSKQKILRIKIASEILRRLLQSPHAHTLQLKKCFSVPRVPELCRDPLKQKASVYSCVETSSASLEREGLPQSELASAQAHLPPISL